MSKVEESAVCAAAGERSVRVYLVRHGESGNNASYKLPDFLSRRESDPSLTKLGEAQAQGAARGLVARKETFVKVFSSAMRRAIQTATPVATALSLPLTIWPEVHEVHGLYNFSADGASREGCAGLGASDIEALCPGAIVPDSVSEVGWMAGRDSETEEQALVRIKAQIKHLVNVLCPALLEQHKKSVSIAIITHHGFLRLGMASLLLGDAAATLNAVEFSSFQNGSFTCIEVHEGSGVEIKFVNRDGHLKA